MSTATADTHHANPIEIASKDVNHDNLGPIPTLDPPERIEVRDGIRTVAFTGQELAFISSERATSRRWTEIAIYRTERGLYVAHRVGATCVAHRIDCITIKGKNLPSVLHVRPDELPVDKREPCDACNPDIMAEYAQDPASIRAEVDRHSAAISENAAALIASLHTNQNGIRTLSGLASAALVQASEHDEAIRAAMSVAIEI